MSRPTAIVVGSSGQDGSILCPLLAGKGFHTIAVSREGWREFSAPREVVHRLDIRDSAAVSRLVVDSGCDRIFYLAAHHSSSEAPLPDFPTEYAASHAVHCTALINFLQAMMARPSSRLFYAASSRVFGSPDGTPQDERSAFRPVDAYGITKAAGIGICRAYRARHGVFASTGILYNHESPRRGRGYVSKKIVEAAVAAKVGKPRPLLLGNLEAQVDWSAAEDVVGAMVAILEHPEPDDFVIASGQPHTVRDFAELAFRLVGLDWKQHVRVDPSIVRPAHAGAPLVGDTRRLRSATGWKARLSWEDMVGRMIDAELSRSRQ